MDEKYDILGNIYGYIADELNISQTMYDKAVRSYEAVGQWIGEGLEDLEVKIMPQGSMNLGTVVRPLTDEDDGYDIDLVCLLRSGQSLPASKIKQVVGNRLKANELYAGKLDKEGKRCWSLQYAGFHMDILPCVPKEYEFSIETHKTAIRLTHKLETGEYVDRYSNPCEYRNWFRNQAYDIWMKLGKQYAMDEQVDIEDVPSYAIRTPLQKVIQLLKRHRDLYFNEDKDKPISIIITTLSALAYHGEENVYIALKNILNSMIDYIDGGELGPWKISNPVIAEENFADKWNAEPIKARTFFSWRKRAIEDLVEMPMREDSGFDSLCRELGRSLGNKSVTRAFNALGSDCYDRRRKNQLYVAGVTSGVTTTLNGLQVKAHNFYGD